MTTLTDTTLPAAPVNRRSPWAWLRRRSTPYVLAIVGAAWLILFFLIPLISELIVSLMTGNPEAGYTVTWNWAVYPQLFTGVFGPNGVFLLRSLWFGVAATLVTILVGYPMAYFIAFRVKEKWKTPLLGLVLVSFLVSFVIRTDMWAFLLSGQGPVISALQAMHLAGANFHIIGTEAAVIGGLAYNDLPFMVLPIYVALERIDPRLFEAAGDLYANPRGVLWRTVLPLSRSGIFAGILLVFVDCAGDPVNASLLGGSNTYTFGQAIQDTYLNSQEYNVASAMSTVLMVALGIILFLYARIVGTDNLEDLV